MQVHMLKSQEPGFSDLWFGRKRHEWRKADRDYDVDDLLTLRRYHPEHGYSGECLVVHVTYITGGGQLGLPFGWCVMDVEVLVRFTKNGTWLTGVEQE